MDITFYMNARARIIYQGITTLAGSLLGSDTDLTAQAIESTFALYRTTISGTPLAAIEHQIAKLVDSGIALPVSNQEAYQAAQWITRQGIAGVPSLVPKAYMLYLAKALVDNSQFSTMNEAYSQLLATKQIV